MVSRRPPRRLAVVVLAAGKGKRMKSELSKVLHQVCGRASLWHVLRAGLGARPDRVAVVVNHDRRRIEDAVRSWGLRPEPVFVDQRKPLGTGHAVMAAEPALDDADEVLVLAGDDPLVTAGHVRELLRVHRRTRAAATILTTRLDDPRGYARVVRDGYRLVDLVVEDQADASPELRAIAEVSTLVYAFRREDLFRALPLVGRENRQGEYYLPDVLSILRDKGERVSAVSVELGAMGLNSRAGLARVAGAMRLRILDEHMTKGVTVIDPETTYVDVGVRIGADTVLEPMTFLEGDTRIGADCRIGPSTRIVDSRVADGAEVSFSVVRRSRIGPRAMVGPFASLRPGTVLAEGAKAGTFVELKATTIGKGSKVPHLSYMGDATVGEGANIGAGAITCNYDGYEKHRTAVGDGAFVGSDTMLVAPVRIGKRAVTGAGSVITRDVPDGALAVERSEQRMAKGYAARRATRAAGEQHRRRGREPRGTGGSGGG